MMGIAIWCRVWSTASTSVICGRGVVARKSLTLEQRIDIAVDKLMALLEDPGAHPEELAAAEAEAEALIRQRDDDLS